jgi:hypothetical protein
MAAEKKYLGEPIRKRDCNGDNIHGCNRRPAFLDVLMPSTRVGVCPGGITTGMDL